MTAETKHEVIIAMITYHRCQIQCQSDMNSSAESTSQTNLPESYHLPFDFLYLLIYKSFSWRLYILCLSVYRYIYIYIHPSLFLWMLYLSKTWSFLHIYNINYFSKIKEEQNLLCIGQDHCVTNHGLNQIQMYFRKKSRNVLIFIAVIVVIIYNYHLLIFFSIMT